MMNRPLKVLREIALWCVAAVGTLCLLAAVAALAFGVRPLIFSSGSMSPGIPTGSLAIAVSTAASEIAPGDIVSVVWSDGHRVTHRVTQVNPGPEGRVTFTTKGDANNVEDAEKLTLTSVDHVVWATPGMGYVIDEVTKPQWVFSLGVVTGALVALVFLAARSRRRAPAARRSHASHRGRAALPRPHRVAVGAATITILAISASLLVNAPTNTRATYADQDAVGGTFRTATVSAPTITGCSINTFFGIFQSVMLSFTMPAGYTSANATMGSAPTFAGLSPSSPSPTISGSGPYTSTYSSSLISTLFGSLFGSTVWIGARTTDSTWTSAWAGRKVTIGIAGFGSSCTAS